MPVYYQSTQQKQIPLHFDNQKAIKIATTEEETKRNKYIDVQ